MGRFSFPCGVTTVTAEQVFASWPGYSYAGDILNLSQSLFTIDLCTESTVSCTGRCGTFDDGCAGVNCGSCPAGQTCTAAQVCCSPANCAGRCGVFADGCGGTLSCGGCLAGQTCTADHVCCTPTTCGDRCGEIADGCGGTLSCGGCPAGQDCNADHLCACVPTMTCEGRCGEIDNGCGVTLVCDGCSPGWTCTIDHVCTCTPTATCDGRCGVLSDGCGGTLSCGGCPAGQVCRANACETATELFSDDFEAYAAGTYPSGGWYLLWSGAGDAQVVEGIAHGGNKSFMLPGETNWVRADGVALDLTGRDRLTYRAAAMVPAGSATGASLGLFERTAPNESRERNAVFLDPGNEIVVLGAVWGHTGIIAQPDAWYVVQADIDYVAQTLDVWIDGAKVVDDLPAWPKVEPNVFFVGTLWSGTACCLSTSYFDDVLLY
ncbi:hypothetical protein HGA89_07765 [bacterium]|nr:hypothetical protein [bacterium]